MVDASGEVRVFHQEVEYLVSLLADIYTPAEPQRVLSDLVIEWFRLLYQIYQSSNRVLYSLQLYGWQGDRVNDR